MKVDTQLYHNSFWLWGELIGYGCEWIDVGLPQPTMFIKTSFGAYLGWAIEGFFATQNGKEFLRDVAQRITIAFAIEGARWRWLPFRPLKAQLEPVLVYNLRNDIAITLPSLQDTSTSEALAYLAKHSFGLAERTTEDLLFDAIRFRVYDFVNANSVNALTYEYVEIVALEEYERIGSKKGISTVKAKARAIYKWVKENYRPSRRNWNYKRKMTQEEYEMTRKENITRINKLRAIEKRKKVEQAVESLKFIGERISVRKVAEYAKVSKDTAQKYLKELKQEGKI